MYRVRMRKNSTKEEVEFDMDLPWEEGSEFWWSDGNMSCDCTRHDKWMEAKGFEGWDDLPHCSDGKYTIVWIESGGKLVYDEILDLT